MAQAILKTNMEDDPLSIEEEKNRFSSGGAEDAFDIPEFPDDPNGAIDRINIGSSKEREAAPSFSLDDDFPEFNEHADDSREEETWEDGPSSSFEPDGNEKTIEKSGIKRRIKAKKIILISVACLSVIISSAIAAKLLLTEKPKPIPAEAPKKVLKRAVPLEYQQEQIELLLIANSQSSRDFVLFELELDFLSLNAHEEYKKNSVLFRDMIYKYLQSQQPAKNSLRYWQEIMEKGLLTHVKTSFPHSGVTSIRVTHLDRL